MESCRIFELQVAENIRWAPTSKVGFKRRTDKAVSIGGRKWVTMPMAPPAAAPLAEAPAAGAKGKQVVTGSGSSQSVGSKEVAANSSTPTTSGQRALPGNSVEDGSISSINSSFFVDDNMEWASMEAVERRQTEVDAEATRQIGPVGDGDG